jgi:hypothetical protein
VSAREFFKYRKLIDEEWNEETKLDHYLAAIAWEVHCIPYRIFGGKPSVKFRDFFMKFKVREDEVVGLEDDQEFQEMTEDEIARMNASKQAMFRALGLGQDGKPVPGRQYATRKPPDIPANAPKATVPAPVERNNQRVQPPTQPES